MIVVVTPNPAVDMTWHLPRIVAGGSHRAATGAVRAGGKGVNVARVAHAVGAPVVSITTAGGASGAELAGELRAAGLPSEIVPVASPTRRTVALVDERRGDTTLVNERGCALSATEWESLRETTAAALRTRSASVLVVSGSLPPGTPEDALPALIGLGHEAGAAVVVDTSGPALLAAAKAGADVLKPNLRELTEATGVDDPRAASRELLRLGAATVLLSLGAEGICAMGGARLGGVPGEGDAPRVRRARLPAALAGNATGAGDAAVAAVAVLLAEGVTDLDPVLRRAVAWSAAAVLMPLAGEIHPSWPELERSVTLDDEVC